MNRISNRRSATGAFIVGTVLAVAAIPGTAQAGFFEQLFGAPSAPPVPTYSYQQPIPQQDLASPRASRAYRHTLLVAPFRRHAAKRVVALRDGDGKPVSPNKPVLQKTTDLMSDKTLRPGDAVMMKDGIHIYHGHEASRHNNGQFVALENARDLKGPERLALVAMDTTHNDPLRGNVAPDTIASGRSAAVGTPIAAGFKITDARGQSVRYVGP